MLGAERISGQTTGASANLTLGKIQDGRPPLHTHTLTYTLARTHTHRHPSPHARSLARTHTHRHPSSHACTHAYTYASKLPRTHARIRTGIHSRTHADRHLCRSSSSSY